MAKKNSNKKNNANKDNRVTRSIGKGQNAANARKAKAGQQRASGNASAGAKNVNREKNGFKTANVIITLQSDVSVGSGYSYAGIIDSDICCDAYGIPYLPARRIKGCMRECAENEMYSYFYSDDLKDGEDKIDNLFGKAGPGGDSAIMMGDAILEDAEAIRREIDSLKSGRFGKYLTKQNVLSYFTDVRGQTKLEGGIAVENTLRFTRVLCKERAPKYIMPIRFEEGYYDEVRDVVRSLRHIGLSRNRGLGNISCVMKNSQTQRRMILKPTSEENDGKSVISYTLHNAEPLMLSNMNEDISETRIRGQSILGILATRYLSHKDRSAEDPEFKDIFLNGKTVFSDAMPSKNGRLYYPAPLYINKLKKTSKLVNIEYSEEEIRRDGKIEEAYCRDNGNIPKKMSGYYSIENGKADFLDVEMILNQHHRHATLLSNENNTVKTDMSEQLYSLEAVTEGQEFSGTIICPTSYVNLIESLLKEEIFTDGMNCIKVGKSKSTQYGLCTLDAGKIRHENYKGPRNVTVNKNAYVKVDFLSDALFVDENYNFTVDPSATEEAVRNYILEDNSALQEVNAACQCSLDDGDSMPVNNPYSILAVDEIAGYRSIWNMNRPPVPVIKAGSVLIFRCIKPCEIVSEAYVGERQNEGLGHIRISVMPTSGYKVETEAICKGKSDVTPSKTKGILKEIIKSQVMEEISLAAYNSGDIGVSASLLGRISLMHQESMRTIGDEDARCQNFLDRVMSVKDEKSRKKIESSLCAVIAEADGPLKHKWHPVDSLELRNRLVEKMEAEKQARFTMLLKDYEDLFGAEEKDQVLGEGRNRYIYSYLISQKYKKKSPVAAGKEDANEE